MAKQENIENEKFVHIYSTCEECGNRFDTRLKWLLAGHAKYCSKVCAKSGQSKSLKAAFATKRTERTQHEQNIK